jgi:DNA invertase Pin-like site-specific DNA recombinase
MPAPRPIRAALHARVSTRGHGEDVGLQLDDPRHVAERRGRSFVGYSDEGVSGASTTRPAPDRMLADAQAGRLDIAAVWKLDCLPSHGVGFVSLGDAGLDTTTPAGSLVTAITGELAEIERGVIQKSVVARVGRARAAGKRCGRPRRSIADKALRVARFLLDDGWGWPAVAGATGIQKDALRRPRDAVVLAQNPTSSEAA